MGATLLIIELPEEPVELRKLNDSLLEYTQRSGDVPGMVNLLARSCCQVLLKRK